MGKRTKASQKRLNNLLIILLLIAALLIMSTYAWFTANRTVNIDQIDVRVATTNGLQISANGYDWKTILTSDDLKDAGLATRNVTTGRGGLGTYAINQMPTNMAPVSTGLTVNTTGNGKLNMYYGKVAAFTDEDIEVKGDPTASPAIPANAALRGKYYLTSTLQNEYDYNQATPDGDERKGTEYEKGYYAAFDVFLKSGNNETNLYFNATAKEVSDIDGAALTGEEKGIANCARIALIKGERSANVDFDSIKGLKTNGSAYMWEPNYDAHTDKALEYNNVLLGWTAPISTGTGTYQQQTCAGLDAAFTTKRLLSSLSSHSTAEDTDHVIKTVVPEWSTTKATPGTRGEIPKAGTYGIESGVTRYRIYLWVEGQDIDCENFASGTFLEYNLAFSLDEH